MIISELSVLKKSAVILLVLMTFGLSLTQSQLAMAASISNSLSTSSVTESKGATLPAEGGGTVVFSKQPVQLTVSAVSANLVDENYGSGVTVIINANQHCGFIASKGNDEHSSSTGRNLGLWKDAPSLTFTVDVYPIYTSTFTGTRTCTLTFSHDAATSPNSNVVSQFVGVSISTKNITISDIQTAPSAPATPAPKPIEITTTKPDVPTAILLDSEGNEIKQTEENPITFNHKDPVIISGTTVPKGKVDLYIFSEPQEAETTADEDGNWTYTIENLEPGDHRVELEVTDPETGETSERAEVLAFSVAQAEEPEGIPITVNDEAVDNSGDNALPLVLIIVVLALGAGGWWWMKKNKKTRPQNEIAPEIIDTEVSTTEETKPDQK